MAEVLSARRPTTVEFEAKPVFQLFDEAALEVAARDALVFYGRGITYGELRDASTGFRARWQIWA